MFDFQKDKAGFFATLLTVPLLLALAVVPATLYIIGQLMGQPDQFSPAIKIVFGICWPLLVFTILIRIWIFRYQMVKKRRAEQESGEQISNGKEKHS
jgi:uncharacterized BrkB/YihY/UPF0761 family membrane protein